MRAKIDPSFWLALFFVGVISAGVVTAARWPWDTRLFPWAIGIPTLALALWQMLLDLKGGGNKAEQPESSPVAPIDIPVDRSVPKEMIMRRTARAVGWIAGFTFGIWFLGFLIAIPLFVFLYLKFEAQAGMLAALLVAVITELFIWGIFDFFMHLAWPEAVLFALLR